MVGILTPQGITIRKGDSFNIVMQFKNGDKPMDLTNCVVKMTVKDMQKQTKFTKVGEIITPNLGKCRIALSPIETSFAVADYQTDIQVTFKNGEVHTVYPQNINTVAYFRLTEQVTE